MKVNQLVASCSLVNGIPVYEDYRKYYHFNHIPKKTSLFK